jgi:hypothetical protein
VADFTKGPSLDFVKYLFKLHNDHRIPLQKLIHALMLWATGYDFRSLIALNAVAAGIASVASILAAKNFRGYSSWGDLTIPFLIIGFGASWTFIGFNFQFLSGIVCMSGFLYFTSRFSRTGKQRNLTGAFWVLFVCAWCGLNGVVLSLVCTVLMGVHLLSMRGKVAKWTYLAMAAAAASNVAQISLWHPSAASEQGSLTFHALAMFVWNMSSASLLQDAAAHRLWKWAFIAVLFVASVVAYFVCRLYRTVSGAAIGSVVVASFALMVAVASGRAASADWNSGYDGHYGYLTVLIPILSWVVLSFAAPRWWHHILTLAVLVFFGSAAVVNYRWRIEYAKEQIPQFIAVEAEIASSKPARSIVDDHYAVLYLGDDREALRQYLATSIVALRLHGGRLYRERHK